MKKTRTNELMFPITIEPGLHSKTNSADQRKNLDGHEKLGTPTEGKQQYRQLSGMNARKDLLSQSDELSEDRYDWKPEESTLQKSREPIGQILNEWGHKRDKMNLKKLLHSKNMAHAYQNKSKKQDRIYNILNENVSLDLNDKHVPVKKSRIVEENLHFNTKSQEGEETIVTNNQHRSDKNLNSFYQDFIKDPNNIFSATSTKERLKNQQFISKNRFKGRQFQSHYNLGFKIPNGSNPQHRSRGKHIKVTEGIRWQVALKKINLDKVDVNEDQNMKNEIKEIVNTRSGKRFNRYNSTFKVKDSVQTKNYKKSRNLPIISPKDFSPHNYPMKKKKSFLWASGVQKEVRKESNVEPSERSRMPIQPSKYSLYYTKYQKECNSFYEAVQKNGFMLTKISGPIHKLNFQKEDSFLKSLSNKATFTKKKGFKSLFD